MNFAKYGPTKLALGMTLIALISCSAQGVCAYALQANPVFCQSVVFNRRAEYDESKCPHPSQRIACFEDRQENCGAYAGPNVGQSNYYNHSVFTGVCVAFIAQCNPGAPTATALAPSSAPNCITEKVNSSGFLEIHGCGGSGAQWRCYQVIKRTCTHPHSGRVESTVENEYTGKCASTLGECF